MDIRTSRSRVNGLLRVQDGKLVNAIGEEVVLRGVGFGNWLLPEGYMWQFHGAWDRPRRIEEAIRTLCGSGYAARFWRTFRDTYVARRDIELVAAGLLVHTPRPGRLAPYYELQPMNGKTVDKSVDNPVDKPRLSLVKPICQS